MLQALSTCFTEVSSSTQHPKHCHKNSSAPLHFLFAFSYNYTCLFLGITVLGRKWEPKASDQGQGLFPACLSNLF